MNSGNRLSANNRGIRVHNESAADPFAPAALLLLAPPGECWRSRVQQHDLMSDPILYQDGLVTIFHDAIVLKHYTFFNFGIRRIPFAEIRTIDAEVPSLRTGKWRIQGTGDLKTWYPLDWKRPSRDTIFIITLKALQMRVGFTVEDSQQVMTILREKGLISSAPA